MITRPVESARTAARTGGAGIVRGCSGTATATAGRRLVGPAATVTATAPAAVHCDGDPVEAARHVEVTLRPRALEILVPTAVAADPNGPFTA